MRRCQTEAQLARSRQFVFGVQMVEKKVKVIGRVSFKVS